MANNQVSSLSDADTRLAALNTEILTLETERSELLRAELANAESRVEEIESFIGVYRASSALTGGAKATQRGTKKKTRAGGKPGPKPKKSKTKAAAQSTDASEKPARRKRGNLADRAEKIKKLVKAAGKEGISARKIAKDADFPYAGVLKILNDASTFKKIGEKRDRRYFIK